MFTEGGICPSEKKLEGSHELELGLVVEILSIILFLPSFQRTSAADGEIQVVFRLISPVLEEKLESINQWRLMGCLGSRGMWLLLKLLLNFSPITI